MVLGLGLFALAMVLTIVLGWTAAVNSRSFDDSKHVNLVLSNGNGSNHK